MVGDMLETSSQQRGEEKKRGKERVEAKGGEDQDELVTSTETQAKEGRVWGRNKGEEQGKKA
jgi:hypothetical protein